MYVCQYSLILTRYNVFSMDLDRLKVYKNSIALGIMLSCNVLSVFVSFIPNGIMILVLVPLIYILRINKELLFDNVNKNILTFIASVSLFSIYSLFNSDFNDVTLKYVIEFFCLGIPFLIVSKYQFDIIVLFRVIVVLGTIAIPFQVSEVDVEYATYDDDAVILMIISYTLLKALVASALLVFIDKNKKFIILAFINIFTTSLFLFLVGSRGTIVAFLFSIFLIVLYINNKSVKLFSLKTFFIIFICFFLYDNAEKIIVFLADFLYLNNVNSIGIERVVDSIYDGGDLSSGRDVLFENAINGFYVSPFLGNGIGAFDNYSGFYPHNVFIQALYEGGIIFGLPIILIIIYSIYLLNAEISKQIRWLYIYVISAELIHLIFSSYFWNSSLFWFMIGFSLRRLKYSLVLR